MKKYPCAICGKPLTAEQAIYSPRTDARYCPVKDWQACENRSIEKGKAA